MPSTLEERVRKAEIEIATMRVQMSALVDKLEDTENALNKTAEAVRALNNLLEQGKGAKIIVSLFVAAGGFGWLAAIATFVQNWTKH